MAFTSLGVVLISTLTFVLGTFPEFQSEDERNAPPEYPEAVYAMKIIDNILVGFFVIEYVVSFFIHSFSLQFLTNNITVRRKYIKTTCVLRQRASDMIASIIQKNMIVSTSLLSMILSYQNLIIYGMRLKPRNTSTNIFFILFIDSIHLCSKKICLFYWTYEFSRFVCHYTFLP